MPVAILDEKSINEILSKVQDGALGTGGTLGTVDSEGKPYVVPMGFKYVKGVIYMFCDYVGEKVKNIRGNPNVCLEVTHRENGRTSTVILKGKAEEFKDDAIVIKIWGENSLKLMRKHAPKGVTFKIKPEKLTGKKYTRRTA